MNRQTPTGSAPQPGGALIVTLGILSMFGPMSIDMYLPSMPMLATDFETTKSNAQLTLSAFTVGFALSQLIYGPMSDRVGRRRVLLFGITLYALAGALCAMAWDIESLIFFRFLQALGGGAGVVLTRAIIRDLFENEAAAKALSLMLLLPSLAALAAPIIGGNLIVLTGDWRPIFWLLAGFGLVVLVLGIIRLPETLLPERRLTTGYGQVLREYGMVLCHRRAMGYALCGGLSFATMFAQLSGTPFIYIELFGVAPENFGYLFALNILGIMGGAYVNSRLVTQFGIRRMLAVGTTIALVGGLALAFCGVTGFGGLYGIVIPTIIFMIPHNITNANAAAGLLEFFPHMAGTASALLGAIRFGIGAAVGALVGIMYDGTAGPMAVIIAACVIGSALSFWFLSGDGNSRKDN
jgi:DHA1 family bicyclomycin/chloramphenicol resistance-like MFS transporter